MHKETDYFKPDYVVAPGEILEETLEVRGIKKNDFADRCGRTPKMISEIISGKAIITPETALQFERVLGVSASLWSNLEAKYRLGLAETEDKEKLQKHADVLKDYPVSDLVKFGFLEKCKDPVSSLAGFLKFFGVGSVEALNGWLDTEQTSYYRSSQTFKSNRYSVAAWLRCGHIKADQINTQPFDADKFKEALKEIRLLTRESNIELALQKTVSLCANAGVALVFVPGLKGTKLSGSARWISKDKALIQLSLRHKSDDHLWFTLFHEAGHILLHGKKNLFIDELDQISDAQEEEADNFAQNTLIPKDQWEQFLLEDPGFSASYISAFAEKQGIAPGIIVGRLQFQERELRPNAAKQNALKVFFEWDSNGGRIIKSSKSLTS